MRRLAFVLAGTALLRGLSVWGALTPEAAGLSSRAVIEWIGELDRLDHPRAFAIMCQGSTVAHGNWRGIIRADGQTNEGASLGRIPIGGLTRLLVYAAAGIAVDKGKLADDRALADLLGRMMKDDAGGAAVADELSARIERAVGESTAAFLVANFINRLEGGLIHNWTAEAQERDKRLMKGSDGVAIEVHNLARVGRCLMQNGMSGKRQLVSETWMKRHPLDRTVVFGGNAIAFLPERDAVAVLLSTSTDRKAVTGAVGRLVAAFAAKPLPEDAAAYGRMKDLCASLKLPKGKMERIEAKPSPRSPGLEHQVLSLVPHGEIRRNSEGDLVGLKDGRILFMWSRMKGSTSDNAKSDICRRYLSADGKAWTDDEVVFPTPEGSLNVMSVSLLRLASGKLALLYLHKRSERDCRPVYFTSSDEGATWSGPVTVVPDSRVGYYVVNNARLVQLKSGRLVIPAAKDGICHWLSDDEGRTWREAKCGAVRTKKPNGDALRMEEPGTIELKDGRLMTYFRTDADWQYVTHSSDGGEHWTVPVPGNLRSPRSPATLERLSDGRIAVAWNDHETHPEYRFLYPYHNGGRTPLTLAFSSDEGRTWTDRLDIETEGWNCYTSLREICGRLFAAYSYGGGLQSLRIAAFELAEFKPGGPAKGVFPRVWTSAYGLRTAAEFEKAVIDCAAHGVDVMECSGGDETTLRERLAICRRHGMKLFIGVEDSCKNDPLAKKTGKYELAVMSGGCYRGLAIDRNLFAFSAAKHEVIVEPPVYSKGQAYAKNPHYYMLGQGHYYGGYVPTGKAEIVVPEKAFDGRQHLRIIPAKVEPAPEGAKPENDSAAGFADSDEFRTRRLVKLSFDLTGLEKCLLDKVGIAVYWKFDDADPKWQSNRASYSLFSPITRERMRRSVRSRLDGWTRANGGKFPSDVVVAVRLGDEIFNATGWLNCPAASFPLWDYSESAIAAFRKATPAGVTYPRTWGAREVYGADACAQFLYLFHKAAADYLKGAVEEAHAVSPSILTFRNTTRGEAWDYGNDHDGTGQELLAQVLDFIHLDPYPLNVRGYSESHIPFDMAYLAGLARRYGKPIVPWMQAHSFPACGVVHPTAKDVRRMYGQHLRFEPDGMMWLGYKPGKRDFTFPDNDPQAWEEAGRIHGEFKRLARRPRGRAELAVIRPYSARAVVGVDGCGASADEKLRNFVRDWSVRLGREFDVFEVSPFQTAGEKAALAKELKGYRKVVSSVDWSGAENVAAARPKPDPRLLKRLRSGVDVIGIVHYTVNTFTDREWGYGSENPKVFNPAAFDAEQIVKACADGGIRGLVIVAKHHDGFCLWPTKTTEHNISKSPFRGGKGDYVKEMEQACRKFGLEFGVYCSPWDRNNAEYGRPRYVETYHEQIRELTGGAYGPIFELWLDGANGGDGYYGGAWEKRSIKDGYYRFEDVVKFVRGHNPDLTIFGFGGEFCWPGNERGIVDPVSGCTRGTGFRPWEADFPLRPGWFYHASQDGFSRSGEFLMKVYLRTVGNAATMDIGISPDRRGRLTDEDVGSLRRFGELRKAFFSKEVASCATPFNLIAMEENIANGERVDEWRITLDGKELVRGGKIGFKRFRTLPKPLCGKDLKLEILRGPAKPEEIKLKLYSVDPALMAQVMSSEEPKRPPVPFELQGVMTVRKSDSLTFMVKHPRTIKALVLTPDKSALGGTPVTFRLSHSLDGEKWTEDPATYHLDNVAANPIPQTVALDKAANVKYVRIQALRTLEGGREISLAGVQLVPRED